MNILHLNCDENRLIAINPDALFSGGQNFDQIQVEFGESWEGFDKTAVFYQDETRVFHIPMIGEIALIPDEVLSAEGLLYIGVYGMSGAMRRTSSVICVLVHKGSFTLGKTESGEDVFSWLTRMLNDKVDKEIGKGLSECDFTSELKSKLENLKNYDDTEIKKEIGKKVTAVSGMGLSHNDFTNELKRKLENLSNYDDTDLSNRVTNVEKLKIPFPVKDGNPVFGTAGFSAKSDGKGGIVWTEDPKSMKNPFAVTFKNTDGSSQNYDGSTALVISLSDCNHADINELFEEYLEFLNSL